MRPRAKSLFGAGTLCAYPTTSRDNLLMTRTGEGTVLMTVPQVARALNVAPATVRRWLGAGDLRGLMVGGSWRVEHAELVAFVEECTRRRLSRGVTLRAASG